MTALQQDLHILFLAPQLYGNPGGVQTYMRRLREILTAYSKARGHQVHYLSLVDACEEKELHPWRMKPATFDGCRGNKLEFVLKALGWAARHRNSLAVVGHIGQAPVAWILSKLGLLRSYILVLHGIEAWKKAVWLDRQAARGAVCIVATTQYTAQEFCKHNGIPPDRLRVIPLALADEKIDVDLFLPTRQPDLAILTVGRLSVDDRHKGIDTLIKAVEKVRNNGAKVRLTVVGDGDDVPRLKELASRLELDGHVAFLGAVPDCRLRKLYQECDVFAMPSKKEGFGIVFLEAMRCGRPCIGGNHGGTPEVITHGVDGYLVDYGDVDQLARYLIEFSQRPALRQEMGLKGYEKVKTGYLFSHMRDNWFALLTSLSANAENSR